MADLSVQGILGLDFLKKSGCKVDLEQGFLEQAHQKVPMVVQGTWGSIELQLKITLVLPQGQKF